MKSLACTIGYGKTDIDFELMRMNRKTLEIAVHPDKSVIVKAPLKSSLDYIEEKVKKKARWIKRQLAYFNQFDPRTPDRKYVGGESHFYLGRKYRLKILPSENDNVMLKNGFFVIEAASVDPEHIKRLLDLWYKNRAEIYFSSVFENCWNNFGKRDIKKPSLKLRRMDKRWGSLSAKGQLTLNLNLIRAPRECIEYVVIHELCHLLHHNHSSEFYGLLERTMPDWVKRKHKLEMALV